MKRVLLLAFAAVPLFAFPALSDSGVSYLGASVGQIGFVDCATSIEAVYTNILLCEDFEDTGYNVAEDPMASGHAWFDAYSGGSPGNGSPCEGPSDLCILDIVTEGSCGIAGQTDCVYSGTQALGLQLVPSKDGGGAGNFTFTGKTELGITMLVKWSDNIFIQTIKTDFIDSEDQGSGRTALPMGGRSNSFNSATTPSCTSNTPTGADVVDVYSSNAFSYGANHNLYQCSPWSVQVPTPCWAQEPTAYSGEAGVVGYFCRRGEQIEMYPDEDVWDFNGVPGPAAGEWYCWQWHVTGWGTTSGTYRQWKNGVLMLAAKEVDTYQGDGFASTISRFKWDNFSNDNGYSGSVVSYRYEDNLVIREGEPVPCEAVGWTGP